MSQIGRCSCGEILAKKSFSTANSSEEMTVEVCPKCDEKKFFSLFGKSEQYNNKPREIDRFGLEKLQK